MTDRTPDFGARLAQLGSTAFTELRPGQRLVLDEYAQNHLGTKDLAIEMPTGAGKTLVALLIADMALDRGLSVAYLTGTRQLAEDVEDEARRLGLDTVRFSSGNYGGARLDDYHQAQAVAVMNYWVYFNSNPVPEPADLVIFDDAHLAEQPLSGLQTFRIPDSAGPGLDLYRALVGLVLGRTDAYTGLPAMLDGTAALGTPPELLSFVDWAALAPAARETIEGSQFVGTDEGRYVWPTVREHLTHCGVLIGPSAIEIRPYHPPTALNPQFYKAKQRLYLSATLGSMDDLLRRTGGNPITQLTPQSPLPTDETGTRKLILNPTAAPALDPAILAWAINQTRLAGGRAAWLCSSHAEADALGAALRAQSLEVFRLRSGDDSAISAWATSASGQLVTAGRYDGLDLAGDMCRLVIIMTVPQGSSEFERFVVAYIGDASYMRHRVGQRLTQALGRANRRSDDRSLYLGLDPAFAQTLADSAVRRSMTSDVQPIVRDALELYDRGWEAMVHAADEFWSVDEIVPAAPTLHTSSASGARRRPGRALAGSSDVSTADAEVAASTALWSGHHQAAVDSARDAAATLDEAGEAEHSAFWRYVEAHAHYDRGRPTDVDVARLGLAEVVENGPRTTWFRRLSRTVDELEGRARTSDDEDRMFLAWDDWRREAGARLEKHLAVGRRLLAGSHNEQCEGLKYLARLAGATGERPPNTEQSATDCRWTWSTNRRAERRVWEVKTVEVDSVPPLSRKDVNQLLGQVTVERRRAPKSRVVGCLLTPAITANDDAADAAHDQIALVNHGAALRLYDLLAQRLRDYDALCGDGSAEARGAARTTVEETMPNRGWLATLFLPSTGKIVTADDILNLFPPR